MKEIMAIVYRNFRTIWLDFTSKQIQERADMMSENLSIYSKISIEINNFVK